MCTAQRISTNGGSLNSTAGGNARKTRHICTHQSGSKRARAAVTKLTPWKAALMLAMFSDTLDTVLSRLVKTCHSNLNIITRRLPIAIVWGFRTSIETAPFMDSENSVCSFKTWYNLTFKLDYSPKLDSDGVYGTVRTRVWLSVDCMGCVIDDVLFWEQKKASNRGG